jgi:hypothetical protein
VRPAHANYRQCVICCVGGVAHFRACHTTNHADSTDNFHAEVCSGCVKLACWKVSSFVQRPARCANRRGHRCPSEAILQAGAAFSAGRSRLAPPSSPGPDRECNGQGPYCAVGVAGFEPTASSSRTKRATKLRHTPHEATTAYRTDPAPRQGGLRAGLPAPTAGYPLVCCGRNPTGPLRRSASPSNRTVVSDAQATSGSAGDVRHSWTWNNPGCRRH